MSESGHERSFGTTTTKVCSWGYSVAKLLGMRRNAIIESKLRMQRLILAEKGVTTNQYCAVFPWTAFCNSIGGEPDVIGPKADIQSPEIDFRFAPKTGHSEG